MKNREDLRIPQISNRDDLTSVIQDMLEPTTQTVEKKLQNAIRDIGVYHPRLIMTYEQLQALQDMGIIKSLPKAVESYGYASAINPTSWPKPFNNLRKSSNYKVYRMWRVAGGEGRVKMKTPYDLMSERNISSRNLSRIAKLFNLLLVEPAEGRLWPPNTDAIEVKTESPITHTGTSDALESPVARAALGMPKMEPLWEITPVPVQKTESVLEPEPEAVEGSGPQVEIEPEPEPLPAPVSTNGRAKSDMKELLVMLNEALLASNIASIQIKPNKEGPTYEIEQIVIRKLTSIDDLV